MTELVVRRLLIDLETPVRHHWCGGDAFRTAFFNALSMSFPVGEQFFIDSVRENLAAHRPKVAQQPRNSGGRLQNGGCALRLLGDPSKVK